jgi:cytochrome b561
MVEIIELNNKRTPKEDEKTKFYYMRLHKSFGLLMAACIIPRILLRRKSSIPLPPPNPELI